MLRSRATHLGILSEEISLETTKCRSVTTKMITQRHVGSRSSTITTDKNVFKPGRRPKLSSPAVRQKRYNATTMIKPLCALLVSCLFICCGNSPAGSSDATNGGGDAGLDASGPPNDAPAQPDASTSCSATELCDGVVDDNCDGMVDEGCGRCPLMTVTCPQGCCTVDRWQVSALGGAGAALAVDGNGDIYFMFTNPNSGVWAAYLSKYTASTGVWTTKAMGAGSYRNRIAIDNAGAIHVVSGATQGSLVYQKSTDGGTTFTAPVALGLLAIGGTFDLAIDSQRRPHVIYLQQRSLRTALVYTHFDGAVWVNETLLAETYDSAPAITLGFADRPYIVVDDYVQGQPAHKRIWLYNGNRWVDETADAVPNQQTVYGGDDYFSSHQLRVNADGSVQLFFTRKLANVETLFVANRGGADTATWASTPITGVTGVTTPIVFADQHNALGAVSDGLGLHRAQTATTWTSTASTLKGNNAAVARRGRFLYVGYIDELNHPTLTVVDLGL